MGQKEKNDEFYIEVLQIPFFQLPQASEHHNFCCPWLNESEGHAQYSPSLKEQHSVHTADT